MKPAQRGEAMQLYNSNLFYYCLYIMAGILFVLWMKLPDHRKRSRAAETWTGLLFCVCIAGAVGTLMRLFPANAAPPERDSSVFLYMGREMLRGKIPYRDLFDHKGPLLYVLQALGFWLAQGSFTGVWVVELLHFMAAGWLLFQACRLVTEEPAAVCMALLVTFGVCGWRLYQGGNFAEEYALPWISWAMLVFLRFCRDNRYRRYEILLLGAAFGAVLLLRANMVSVWIACIPYVLIRLLAEKRFRDIGVCTLLFTGGLSAVLLPVIAYGLSSHSLQPLWEDYILFNLLYTGESWSGVSAGFAMVLGYLKILWPAAVVVVIAPFLVRKQKGLLFLNAWAFMLSFVMALMSGRGYGHYVIVLLPLVAVPFAGFFALIGERLRKWEHGSNPTVIALSGVLILAAAVGYRVMRNPDTGTGDELLQYLQEETAPEEDILILGNSCRYYLLADRRTECRFFYQTPPAELSEELFRDFIGELKAFPPDRIVIPYGEDAENTAGTRMTGLVEMLEESAHSVERYGGEFEVIIPDVGAEYYVN